MHSSVRYKLVLEKKTTRQHLGDFFFQKVNKHEVEILDTFTPCTVKPTTFIVRKSVGIFSARSRYQNSGHV